MRTTLLLIVASVVLLGSLQAEAAWKSRRRKRYDCARQLQRALTRYEKGRFNEVKAILAETKMQCNGHNAMDSILYYLGIAKLKTRSPQEAKIEFERLVIDFANSAFHEEALFRIGHCSYAASNPPMRDQSTTRDAVRELNNFIDTYPESPFADSAQKYLKKSYEKLAEKEYRNARFYEKIEKWESAIVYYRELITAYPESKYVPESKYAIAHALNLVQRPTEARDILKRLLEEKPGSEIERKARLLLSRLNQSKQSDAIDKPQDAAAKKKKPRGEKPPAKQKKAPPPKAEPEPEKKTHADTSTDKSETAPSEKPDTDTAQPAGAADKTSQDVQPAADTGAEADTAATDAQPETATGASFSDTAGSGSAEAPQQSQQADDVQESEPPDSLSQ
jgi:outer membrane protein assembly factor BamD